MYRLVKSDDMIKAVQAQVSGDQCLLDGNYDDAINNYYDALARVSSLSDSVPLDKNGMIAYISAGMSAAFGGLEKNTESINAADIAINIFEKDDKTYRVSQPINFFSRWSMAIQNKGVALAKLGYYKEALDELNRVKKMVTEKDGSVNPANLSFLEGVNSNIDSIYAFLKRKRKK